MNYIDLPHPTFLLAFVYDFMCVDVRNRSVTGYLLTILIFTDSNLLHPGIEPLPPCTCFLESKISVPRLSGVGVAKNEALKPEFE